MLHMPVDVRNLSLALLALFASVALLHWASAVFIPIMLSLLLTIALPLTDGAGLDLARVGDDLAVTVDGTRRLVALPPLLRRREVVDAEAGGTGLVLRFAQEGPE